MAIDRSYVAENERERRRLETLVARLDDAALSRSMPGGWTVAGVLAHLAFWDQRIVLFVDLLKRGVKIHDTEGDQVDWVNDAMKPLQLALPARRAAEVAVAAAREADRAVETLSDELLAKNVAAGTPIYLLRAGHRREHLDEIEAVVGRG
jgi:hypothetical protein